MASSFNVFLHRNSLSSLPRSSVTSLPAYTRRSSPPRTPSRTEHVVELPSNLSNKNAKPWATLRVYSKAPTGALPAFVEGEKIEGSVTLDSSMSNSRHISYVKVIVRGELSSGAHEEDRIIFLETSTSLWSKDTRETRQDGSLYSSWPFSISLPRQVIISGNMTACVRYNLIVHISRSKFREDSNLQTTFVYIPAIRPDPPSALRTLAYQENSPLLGPQQDPSGWYSLPSTKVYGTLFGNRVVEVTCRLFLAKPLSYTRGSVIPLSLTLTSTDAQALDLLCSRQALTVKLRRKVTSRTRSMAEYNALWYTAQVAADSVDDLHTALWWKRPGDNDLENATTDHTSTSRLSREMEGEILLSKNLKPTFQISHLGVEYSVVMLPFTTTSFVPSTRAQKFHNGPILEERVEITTMFPKGPRPIAHSPPEYQQAARSSLPPSRASLASRGR